MVCVDAFKKMYGQKFKEMEKAYDKQEKMLKSLKAHGKSKISAVSEHSSVARFQCSVSLCTGSYH